MTQHHNCITHFSPLLVKETWQSEWFQLCKQSTHLNAQKSFFTYIYIRILTHWKPTGAEVMQTCFPWWNVENISLPITAHYASCSLINFFSGATEGFIVLLCTKHPFVSIKALTDIEIIWTNHSVCLAHFSSLFVKCSGIFPVSAHPLKMSVCSNRVFPT